MKTLHLTPAANAASAVIAQAAASSAPLVPRDENKELALSIARIAHEVNAAYCASLGDYTQVSWEEAPEWQKDSAIMGALLHMSDPTKTPEDSHKSWMAQKIADGWVYGEKKDPVAKTHHCIVPYEQLPQEQRSKDFIFRGTVHAIMREQLRT